jgi:hypothetical protein
MIRAKFSAAGYLPGRYMESDDHHLSIESIRAFAYGVSLLEPDQLAHFQNCDECSHTWWRLKQEAKREKGEDMKEKSA